MSATITSVAATSCTVTASQGESGGYKFVTATQSYSFSAISASSDLLIAYNASPIAGVPLTLTINSGGTPTGNGNPTANWSLIPADIGCSLSATTGGTVTLTDTNAKTCVIQVSQAPYGNYTFKQSRSLAITFGATPAPTLTVTNTTNNYSPTTAQTITLSVDGGNGNPTITYSVAGNGCDYTIATKALKASTGSVPACTIIAMQQAYGIYTYAQSAARTILFTPAPASAIIFTTSTGTNTGTAGTAFIVTATGGNGSLNSVTWSSAGAACGTPSQGGKTLTITSTASGSCTVTASQPAANGLAYVSATQSFNFNATSSGIPSLVIARSGTPTAGSNYSLTINDNGSPAKPTGNGNPAANWSITGSNCSFSGSSSGVATVNVLTTTPTTCVIQASQAPYGIYAYTQSPSLTLTFATATADPISLTTDTTPVAGGTVVVSVGTGSGNGNPTVNYTVSGAGCQGVTSGGSVSITTTGIAYCNVQALQPAYGAKSYAVSPATTLTFAAQNYSGSVSITPTTGALPSIAFALANNATRFADRVSYQVSGNGCTYDATTKTITTPGAVNTYCSVIPFWPYGSPYNPAYYNPVTLSFTLIPQETAFTISNALTSATAGTPITVTTRGGTGAGAISFTSVSSKGVLPTDSAGSCNIVNNNNGTATISSAVATTCSVTATKAAASQYASAKTQTIYFTFVKP